MLLGKSTKYGAGFTLSGDYNDLVDLHETIHYLASESGPISENHYEFVLGLAYDVRHAYQGDIDVSSLWTPLMPVQATLQLTYFGRFSWFKSVCLETLPHICQHKNLTKPTYIDWKAALKMH